MCAAVLGQRHASKQLPGCNAPKTRLKAQHKKQFRTDGSMTRGRILVTLALLAAVVTVTACGRKTGLDTPYEAAEQARKDAERAKQPVPPEPEKPVKDRKFILDPLL